MYFRCHLPGNLSLLDSLITDTLCLTPVREVAALKTAIATWEKSPARSRILVPHSTLWLAFLLCFTGKVPARQKGQQQGGQHACHPTPTPHRLCLPCCRRPESLQSINTQEPGFHSAVDGCNLTPQGIKACRAGSAACLGPEETGKEKKRRQVSEGKEVGEIAGGLGNWGEASRAEMSRRAGWGWGQGSPAL